MGKRARRSQGKSARGKSKGEVPTTFDEQEAIALVTLRLLEAGTRIEIMALLNERWPGCDAAELYARAVENLDRQESRTPFEDLGYSSALFRTLGGLALRNAKEADTTGAYEVAAREGRLCAVGLRENALEALALFAAPEEEKATLCLPS
jgi:hypothetical protein